MMIRAHDPCLSCATHALDGRVAVSVDIIDSAGRKVATLAN
jgi:F420-non-reducing hydrogenase large subunit